MMRDYEAATAAAARSTTSPGDVTPSARPRPATSARPAVHTAAPRCDLSPPQIEQLFKAFQEARLPAPPTDCLAPIGVRQMLAGMLKGVKAEFYAASSREPEVYRGRPFQIEAAIAFGGELPADDTARVIRFANRVPLLFSRARQRFAASPRPAGATTPSASPATACPTARW